MLLIKRSERSDFAFVNRIIKWSTIAILVSIVFACQSEGFAQCPGDRDCDSLSNSVEDYVGRHSKPAIWAGAGENCGPNWEDPHVCFDGQPFGRHLPGYIGYDVKPLGFSDLYAVEYTVFLDFNRKETFFYDDVHFFDNEGFTVLVQKTGENIYTPVSIQTCGHHQVHASIQVESWDRMYPHEMNAHWNLGILMAENTHANYVHHGNCEVALWGYEDCAQQGVPGSIYVGPAADPRGPGYCYVGPYDATPCNDSHPNLQNLDCWAHRLGRIGNREGSGDCVTFDRPPNPSATTIIDQRKQIPPYVPIEIDLPDNLCYVDIYRLPNYSIEPDRRDADEIRDFGQFLVDHNLPFRIVQFADYGYWQQMFDPVYQDNFLLTDMHGLNRGIFRYHYSEGSSDIGYENHVRSFKFHGLPGSVLVLYDGGDFTEARTRTFVISDGAREVSVNNLTNYNGENFSGVDFVSWGFGPTADAGADRTLGCGDPVILDARGSYKFAPEVAVLNQAFGQSFAAGTSKDAAYNSLWTFDWYNGTQYLGRGPVISAILSSGTNRIRLKVTGARFVKPYIQGSAFSCTVSDYCNIMLNGVPPEQVTGVTASDTSCANIAITWGNVAGELGYKVYRNGSQIGATGANVTAFTEVPVRGTYNYTVRAYNSCGDGPLSIAVAGTKLNCPPDMPGNPTPPDSVGGILPAQVLSWTGSDPDPLAALNYDVHLGTTYPPPLVSAGQTASSYDPTPNLQDSLTYFWQIVAHDQYGNATAGPIWNFATVCGGVGWSEQSSGTTRDFYGIAFVDVNNGWAVGESGTIRHSSNGGTAWSTQIGGVNQRIYDVAFANANNGWAVTDKKRTILHTSNGGSTWNEQPCGSRKYRAVAFADTANGWVVGDKGSIMHTTNGGISWNAQTSGTNNDLYAVAMVDANTGWAVGGGGSVLHTTNGGGTWSAQPSGTTRQLKDVAFANVNTGWAVGSSGTILHTTNGGNSWSAQPSGTTRQLNGIAFTNVNTGWAVGSDGTILHTTNGGNSWSAQPSGTTRQLNGVAFANTNKGWAVGDRGEILSYYAVECGSPVLTLVSPNGGEAWNVDSAVTIHWTSSDLADNVKIEMDRNYPNGTWETISSGTPNTGCYVWTVNGFDTYKARIRITSVTDRMVNDISEADFTITSPPEAPGNPDPADLAIGVLSTQILGWTRSNQDPLDTLTYDVYLGTNYPPPLVSAGQTATLYDPYPDLSDSLHYFWQIVAHDNFGHTTPGPIWSFSTICGGVGWSPQTSGTNVDLRGVAFVDVNNGWAVGQQGTILRTVNGGTTWRALPSGTNRDRYGVAFADANNGWAVGRGAGSNDTRILHTENGGEAWSAQSSETNKYCFGVAFVDANTGWTVGQQGTVRHTTNGGSTWSAQPSGTNHHLYAVASVNASNSWTVGESGTILHTTNGGSTWTTQVSGTTNSLYAVAFANVNTGWAVGSNGTILNTTNGGNSWSAQPSGTTRQLNGVAFADANNGWAVGDQGTVRHTTNGGVTWNVQASGTTASLYAVAFTNMSTGWAVGTGGTILHYYLNDCGSPRLALANPNGGENCHAGDLDSIRWTSFNLSENVQIEVNRTYPGGAWEVIAAGAPNTGLYVWPVTGPSTKYVRVRVRGMIHTSVGDTSHADFTIVRVPLTAPDHLVIQYLPSSDQLRLSWSSTGASAYSVYSSTSADGSFSDSLGTTSDTTLIIPAPSDARRFYTVVSRDHR